MMIHGLAPLLFLFALTGDLHLLGELVEAMEARAMRAAALAESSA